MRGRPIGPDVEVALRATATCTIYNVNRAFRQSAEASTPRRGPDVAPTSCAAERHVGVLAQLRVDARFKVATAEDGGALVRGTSRD